MSAFVGEMILEVRQARGISLRQLSRQVGILVRLASTLATCQK